MIVIDAGHGGSDPGTSGNGIIEKNMALDISNYMFNRFRELGIPVTMTRTGDDTISPTERTTRILDAFGNRPDVLVISNHLNAGGGEGAEVIYALRNTPELSNLVLDELSREGQKIRRAYQRRLPSDPTKDYYFIHRNTGVTQPIIVEYGFLDNAGDASRLKAGYQKYSEAVVRAVMRYLNLPYTAPGSGATGNEYVVRAGDSLWSIARKFGTSVDALKSANNLTSNLLSIGQRLVIPGQSGNTNETPYVVQPGDSLYNIARRFGTSVDAIMKRNNLSNTTLSIGKELIIPSPNETIVTPPTTPIGQTYLEYTVKPGETLYGIGQTFGITPTQIMQINNLSGTNIMPGQIIRIPSTLASTTYTVQKGDTLYSIANKLGTTVDAIQRKNNLTTSALSIGQILKI